MLNQSGSVIPYVGKDRADEKRQDDAEIYYAILSDLR